MRAGFKRLFFNGCFLFLQVLCGFKITAVIFLKVFYFLSPYLLSSIEVAHHVRTDLPPSEALLVKDPDTVPSTHLLLKLASQILNKPPQLA